MFEANRWNNAGVRDVLCAGTNFLSGLWDGGFSVGHSLVTVRKYLRHEEYQEARQFFRANRGDFTQSMLEPQEWAILTCNEEEYQDAQTQYLCEVNEEAAERSKIDASIEAYRKKYHPDGVSKGGPAPAKVVESNESRMDKVLGRLERAAELYEEKLAEEKPVEKPVSSYGQFQAFGGCWAAYEKKKKMAPAGVA